VSGAPSPPALNARSQSGHAGVRDGLEARTAMLCGTIRERGTQQRRAFVWFFLCEQELGQEPPDARKTVLTPDFRQLSLHRPTRSITSPIQGKLIPFGCTAGSTA
jgi:hypothetical protein